jgi:predicted dehydrogenase
MAALMALMGGVEISRAQTAGAPASGSAEPAKTEEPSFTTNVAVIGLGVWGREIVNTLSRLSTAKIVAVCDNYGASLKRGKNLAPKAEGTDDYKAILANKDVQAVIVATPTHLHREIVIAALEAGKHVYCEAPLAATMEEAKAIALAAKKSFKQVFQSGLQLRSDPQRHFLLQFVRAGAMGTTLKARAQWHKKQSMRFTSPNPDRERDLNWRLRKESSPGFISELGIHQIDMASWFIGNRPTAVNGYGETLVWNDGREIPDTISAWFEFPRGVRFTFDSTLGNSFDSDYEMYYGTDAAIMVRQHRAWMFKEVDSPLLGWEVYARKDTFFRETGIALVANATKLKAQGDNPLEDAPNAQTPLYFALESFMSNVNEVSTGVEDFISSYGEGKDEQLKQHVAKIARQPAAGFKEGYEATVMVLKAHEAVMKGEKIRYPADLFELA